MAEDTPKKPKLVEIEENILSFWTKEKIFEKSIAKEAPKGDFVFYDGPPFATGLPHFGHLLPTAIKDAVPRYKTMQGYRVRRRWGWDCHGLPVENLIEKELGLASKKDIEEYGIAKFNEAARSAVLRYEREWRHIIPRIGRWADMDNDYKTMDATYTESVWWAFKSLHEKGLIYEGYKSMQICPRCGTTLSNFEVSQGYKDVTDISVYVEFELIDMPQTYLIAWTTTPWTLPGNVALAVGPHVEYVLVEGKVPGNTYIVGKFSLEAAFGTEYKIIRTIDPKEIIGKRYKPVFPYYDTDDLNNRKNAWKVYPADFVTTDSGTGIVHIAPAFGEDDMNVGKLHALPFIQHVSMDGRFKKEVKDFAGREVKPKADPQSTDIEIIKYLAEKGVLFAKKKIIHSYPHCWRCETPLLNYATSSWFVRVSDFRDKLVAQNEKVSWVPEAIGSARFGDWLKNARDWAISRSRYWGAPIPVWKCEKCDEMTVVGSLRDIARETKPKNHFILMRHGQSENNVTDLVSVKALNPHHLTEKGRAEVKAAGESLKHDHVDLIVASPFVRTRETAEIVADEIGYDKKKIVYDTRIGEFNIGSFDGKTWKEYRKFIGTYGNRFLKAPDGGETLVDVRKRVMSLMYELDKAHRGKTILIVSHDEPLFTLSCNAQGIDQEKLGKRETFLQNAGMKKIDFVPLPHDHDFKIDFHRPYIDHIELSCSCGGVMRRVPEVFDCWFESGSMPYAEAHYPFEKDEFEPKKIFKSKGFPADFIAEGLDQTRGWFYSMIVLGTSLFGKSPYKHVVVNGLILAEDGQKMSKSKGNYPPLLPIVEKYSADALRLFLLMSPAVHAEDVRFSEKGVDEVAKKFLQRLDNVLAFYEMYKTHDSTLTIQSENVLDRWIMARLSETGTAVTHGLESYELDRATRPLVEFVDDLSNWYIRRSRDRFKSDDDLDKKAALMTTRYVLLELSKLMAPFTPFYAEYLFTKVKDREASESVHLEQWPKMNNFDKTLIQSMKETRRLVSLGLEQRAKANLKVRQPLGKVTLSDKKEKLSADLAYLLTDELNVKSVAYGSLSSDIEIDTTITPELRAEGIARELMRFIQDMRKEQGFAVGENATLSLEADERSKELFALYRKEIEKTANVEKVIYEHVSEPKTLSIEGFVFNIRIRK